MTNSKGENEAYTLGVIQEILAQYNSNKLTVAQAISRIKIMVAEV